MSVSIDTLDAAMIEVRRFVEAATAAKKALKCNTYGEANPLERGAVKRASMDLTRALVNIRKRNTY